MNELDNQLKLLSISKAAKALKISVSSLKRLINDGKVKVIIINKQMKIPYVELVRFIQTNLTNVQFNLETIFESKDSNFSSNQTFNSIEFFNEILKGVS